MNYILYKRNTTDFMTKSGEKERKRGKKNLHVIKPTFAPKHNKNGGSKVAVEEIAVSFVSTESAATSFSRL